MSDLVHGAGDRVGAVAHDAADVASRLGGEVRRTGERVYHGAERSFDTTMQDNPLVLGAVALAVGAAIGLSLPHSDVEDEWMGEAREHLVQSVQTAAGEAIHKVESAAGQLASGESQTAESSNGHSKDAATKNASPSSANA